MRLWTLHPKYLDRQGLVALWREALLASAVLRGATRGYKNHPQMERFRANEEPESAINAYLAAVSDEAASRGYSFDRSKIGTFGDIRPIAVSSGQVQFEWQHLLSKLSSRSPWIYDKWNDVADPESHPLFYIVPGPIEPWERGQMTL